MTRENNTATSDVANGTDQQPDQSTRPNPPAAPRINVLPTEDPNELECLEPLPSPLTPITPRGSSARRGGA